MRKAIQPAQSLAMAKLGSKDNLSTQMWHEIALTRHAKLLHIGRAQMGNNMHHLLII